MSAQVPARPTLAALQRAQRPVRAAAATVSVVLAAVLITLTSVMSAAAQPPPTPPVPLPSTPATPAPTTTTPAPTPVVPPSRWITPPPTTSPASPTPGVPDSTVPAPGSPGPGAGECGVSNISGCVAKAIDGFFQRLVDSALNPLLELVSHTLLTTPEPGDLPQIGVLWNQSWQLVLALYGLLVTAAGVLLMVRETLQTRWSWRELATRLVVGFLAAAMSMVIATTAIGFANALAQSLAGDGVDSDSDTAAAALTQLAATSGTAPGTFTILLMLALVVMLVVLLVAYVVRVAVTIILIVSAPLALMCHALPGLETVARWWWHSFAACLAIQVVQSLTLVTVLRVFLTPGGWNFFAPNANGIVDLIVALALMGVLIKTPFWLLSVLRIGHGRTFAGSIVRSYIVYKTLGLLKGTNTGRGRGASATPTRLRQRGWRTGATGPRDPYARVRATRDGQLMLPLEGVHRVRRQPTPTPTQPPAALKTTPGHAPRGRQLAFDFTPSDPYRGIRPGRGGQYPLPIPVSRVKPTSPAEPPRPPARATAPRGHRPEQLTFDFEAPTAADPYRGIRPGRGGQYTLPFPVPRGKPAPRPPTPPQPPSPAPTRPAGRQLHLPLPDLPVRRRAPRAPRGGKLR